MSAMMDKDAKGAEDKKLLDRIRRINRHKNSATSQGDAYSSQGSTDSWRRPRTEPYPKERGGHGGHRNRTLVLNKSGNNTSSADEDAHKQGQAAASRAGSGWITKRDRHVQLINPSVYDKETQSRSKAMEETRRQKAQQRDRREKRNLRRHFQVQNGLPGPARRTSPVHQLEVDGLRFRVLNGGSKLARIRGPYDSATSTPKQAVVGGVTFLRSKNGNLYRSGLIRKHAAAQVVDEPSTVPGRDDLVSDGDDEGDADDPMDLDSDDMDSAGLEEMLGTESSDDATPQGLSEQPDYVGL
ncbi:MAG: hypothetical protein Q9163_003197 [Psora crenata]